MGHFDFSPSKTGFSIFKNKEHSTVKGVINTYVDPEIHCISAYGLPFPSIPRSPSIIIRFTAASHALRQRIFTGITLLFVIPKIISLASRCCSDSIVSNLQSTNVDSGSASGSRNSLSPGSLEHVCFLIMADVHFQPLYNTPPPPPPTKVIAFNDSQ